MSRRGGKKILHAEESPARALRISKRESMLREVGGPKKGLSGFKRIAGCEPRPGLERRWLG